MSQRVSIAQIGFDAQHIDQHLEKLIRIVDEHADSDLIVFPELILHGHPSVDEPEGFLYRQARVVYGQVSSKLYKAVRDADATVIFGQIQRRVDNLYNVATYVDSEILQHYVKTHVHWTENFVPGNKLRVFDSGFGPVGVNICFDAAFSEVWRVLEVLGARLAVNISAVPASFAVEYMHRRMAAAALNNQMYVVYANRPGPRFAGHSAVFDPRGRMIASAESSEKIFTAEIDFSEVDAWRQEEQLELHRRPKLYRPLLQQKTALVEPDLGAEIEISEPATLEG